MLIAIVTASRYLNCLGTLYSGQKANKCTDNSPDSNKNASLFKSNAMMVTNTSQNNRGPISGTLKGKEINQKAT
jgi:hypothetical protein